MTQVQGTHVHVSTPVKNSTYNCTMETIGGGGGQQGTLVLQRN